MQQPVVVRWPGGEHAFRLGLAEIEALQQKTDCGPEFLLHKINAAQWKLVDLTEVLRNGLIGGGMPHVEAKRTVSNAVDLHPLIAFKVPAAEVLAASLYGPPEDEDDLPGEAAPVMPAPETEKTASGPSD